MMISKGRIICYIPLFQHVPKFLCILIIAKFFINRVNRYISEPSNYQMIFAIPIFKTSPNFGSVSCSLGRSYNIPTKYTSQFSTLIETKQLETRWHNLCHLRKSKCLDTTDRTSMLEIIRNQTRSKDKILICSCLKHVTRQPHA